MKIVDKFKEKSSNLANTRPITIAFLGDSVTQGCFECYLTGENSFTTVFDKTSAYHNYIARIFSILYPSVPVNIINAGISGESAAQGLLRLDRDVLSFDPDLVVVCFGLNDSGQGVDGISLYTEALDGIFKKLTDAGKEIIFMTPNMMNTYMSSHIKDQCIIEVAKETCKTQTEGILDRYLDEAKKVCNKYDVPICDCYKKWKRLSECGIDITELLANKINHPTREMNWMFAYSLVETMLGEGGGK